MKKLFLIALPLMLLASCSREPMELAVSKDTQKSVTVKVTGDSPEETKTIINEANRTLLWGGDEHLAVYELYYGYNDRLNRSEYMGAAVKSAKGVTTNGGWTMTFDATLPGYSGSSTLTYAAVYPFSALDYLDDYNLVEVSVPSVQTGIKGTFDPDGDILLGEARTFDTQQTDLHFHFRRMTSILKLTIKNLNIQPGAKVVSVKLQTPNKGLSSTGTIDIIEGTLTPPNPDENQGSKSVKLNCKGMDITDGTFDVWFNVWPVTFTNPDNLTVYVTTSDGYKYSRAIIMQDPALELKAGQVTPVAVNMTNANRTTVSDYSKNITFSYTDPTAEGISLEYDKTEARVVFTCQEDWVAEITGDDDGWFTFGGKRKVSGTNASYYYLYVNCNKNIGEAPKTATVTISNDFTEKSFTITQENCVSLTGAALSQTSLNLVCGQSQTLSVIPVPATASNYKVSWSVEDFRTISVDYDVKADAPELVVTANMVGSATITATVTDKETGEEFVRECTVTNTVPAFTAPNDVLVTLNRYVYKYDSDLGQYVSYYVPTVVRNGEEIPLYAEGNSYNNSANCVTVANGKLIVAGSYEKNPDNLNDAIKGACYWLSGKMYKLPQYQSLDGLVADGNDVYVIASWYDSDNHYALLKNWEQVVELDAISVSNIVIDNGDWYVCGKDSGWQTCYWKNGVKTTIEGLYSASAIDVKDGNIYIAGDAYDTRPNINVWHNGEVTKWSSWTASYQAGYADRVFIIGSDIWVIGRYVASGKTAGVRLYKNGKEVFFPAFDGSQFENRKYDKYELRGAQVFDGQFYLLYSLSYTGSNAFHNPSQALWKTLYYEPAYVNADQRFEEFSNGMSTLEYTDIFVTSEPFSVGGTMNPPYENPFDNEEEQW